MGNIKDDRWNAVLSIVQKLMDLQNQGRLLVYDGVPMGLIIVDEENRIIKERIIIGDKNSDYIIYSQAFNPGGLDSLMNMSQLRDYFADIRVFHH